jgi:hypothetical protein
MEEMKTTVPAVEAEEGIHPAWPAYEFVHKNPFATWAEFAEEMQQYFLMTETHAEAVKKLRDLKQGNKTIEEFIIEFKGWAQLAGFDRIALVDQFKRGINTNLGQRIIKLGMPGDGTDPTHLQHWYDRATKLKQQKQDIDQYYGKQESFLQKKKKWNKKKKAVESATTSTHKPKTRVISAKVKDENAMDVDTTKTTTWPPPICYSCGKKGHIARNDGRRKIRDEEEFGFCGKSLKDSPALEIPVKYIYESIQPSEYISIQSIMYELKQKEGSI